MDSLFDFTDDPADFTDAPADFTDGQLDESFSNDSASSRPSRLKGSAEPREGVLSLFDRDEVRPSSAPSGSPLPWERTSPAPGSGSRRPEEGELLDPSALLELAGTPRRDSPDSALRPVSPRPSRPRLTVATDGSSLGNPGPGGWGWFVSDSCWAADGVADTTNNAMELEAIRQALLSIPSDVPLLIQADSSYAISALTEWHHGWARRGWKTAAGKPVANVAQIRAILALLEGRDVRFEHVRGHQGHRLNESADSIARGAAEAVQAGRAPDRGPGYTES